MKAEGFKKSADKPSAPLDRLEKSVGSTFSESSLSTASDALRFTGAEVAAEGG